MAIEQIDQRLCYGCSTCFKVCPMDVIRMKGGKARIVYREDCMTCFLCEMDCPAKAIYVGPDRARYIPMAY